MIDEGPGDEKRGSGQVFPRLFGTNGIRGIVNERLTPEFVFRVGLAVGTFARSHGLGSVFVATDTRTSAEMLKRAVASGVLSSGVDVVDCGVCVTPALQYLVKSSGSALGVMITASHNPPEFNGIKCVSSDGTEMSREEEMEIEKLFHTGDFFFARWDGVGSIGVYPDGVERYVSGVLERVDVDLIRGFSPRVAVDCASGASSLSTPLLLDRLSLGYVSLNASPSGRFPAHPSEPTPENLADIMVLVKEGGFDFGVAHDGDGDRAIFVDDRGRYLFGDKTLGLLAMDAVERAGGGVVVVPVNTSSLVEEVVREKGGSVVYTRVGSPIVARKMMETGAVFGGEENGGLIFPEHQYCRDGLMTLARMLEIVSEKKKPLSEMVDALPEYYLAKKKVRCNERAKEKLLEEYLALVRGGALSFGMDVKDIVTLDGIKVVFDRGWMLVRPSGTEPIIRVQAEGKTPGEAEELANLGVRVVGEILEDMGSAAEKRDRG